VISTYGWRSNWVRNIQRCADVQITAGGWVLSGRAELVEALERKLELVSRRPFFPIAPFTAVHALLRTLLRPLLVLLLRRWVRPRPIVVVHPLALVGDSATCGGGRSVG
jgi:hypothetical protein